MFYGLSGETTVFTFNLHRVRNKERGKRSPCLHSSGVLASTLMGLLG